MIFRTPEERTVYEEAVRTVPGMLATKFEGTDGDARVLLAGYHDLAGEQGLAPCQAWSLLFTAALHWGGQLTRRMASERGVEPGDISRELAAMASTWSGSRG